MTTALVVNPTIILGGYLVAALFGGVLVGLAIGFLIWRGERQELMNRMQYGRDYLYMKSEQDNRALSPDSSPDEIRKAVEKSLRDRGINPDKQMIEKIAKQKEDMLRAGRTDLL